MIGKTLKHYHIEELLGKGGMGEVYRAFDTKLRRPVAIKVLKSELTENEDRRKRFIQEARSAAAVIHPAIAQIYDVDEEKKTIFIVMEYVAGETVSQLIVKKELDLMGAVEIALQVSQGLGSAHKAGIVHRDIKSDNIMVTRDGHAKLLDFGLAKLLDPANAGESTLDIGRTATIAKTIAGTVMGTIAYMSPEQARGQDIDQSSDVFSLGIVLYEMVTGDLPFKGDSPLDTMHSIAFDEARPVTVIRKNLPPQLHKIISRCLRKRPQDRYANAGELEPALKQLKQELDSGIQSPLAPMDRLQAVIDWIKSILPVGPYGILAAVLVLTLATLLILTEQAISSLFMIAFLGLLTYRYIRNRKDRMIKKFSAKISRYPEVIALIRKEDHIMVIVDEARAKLYIRVNDLIETLNKKIYFGKKIEVAIRDDLLEDNFQKMLREPGVLYVRDDVIQKKLK